MISLQSFHLIKQNYKENEKNRNDQRVSSAGSRFNGATADASRENEVSAEVGKQAESGTKSAIEDEVALVALSLYTGTPVDSSVETG